MGQREDRWMEEWREEIKARSCQQTGDLCEVLAACYLTLQKILVLGLIGPKIIKKNKIKIKTVVGDSCGTVSVFFSSHLYASNDF